MNVGASFVADGQSPKTIEPGETALHDPAMLTKALLALDSTTRDPGLDVTSAASVPAAAMIVCLVGVQFVWPASWPAASAGERRDGIDDIFEWHAVVNIGARQLEGQRNAVPIRGNVAFGSGPSAVCRIGADLIAPFFAAMDEASTQTLLQSI